MQPPVGSPIKGRGAQSEPPNRFERVHVVPDWEQCDRDDLALPRRPTTEYFWDDTRSIVAENDSPDLGFRYSVNPYRGCLHGCSYCYARPTHEYFGLNAGLDFESKLFVKRAAPQLFRQWLARPAWQPELIVFSGNTDCYQPAERHFKLTRQCLEVALEARQPIGIVTKNALVSRDVDILAPMARLGIVRVAISITTLEDELARQMEPRTSSPQARLRAIRELREAQVPTVVFVAPVIPGLNDHEVPGILRASAEAGAEWATYILLRLPGAVQPVFLEWLEQFYPERKKRVESCLRAVRDGQLNDSQFGSRMRGGGPLAEQIKQTFATFAKKYGLDTRPPTLDASQFRCPRDADGQLSLF